MSVIGKKTKLGKVMVIVGPKYKLFSAVKYAGRPVDNESPYFEELLEKKAKRHAGWIGWLGCGYLSRHNCDLVTALGGVARFYPKKGTVPCQKGSAA